jgi:hypothetical protein
VFDVSNGTNERVQRFFDEKRADFWQENVHDRLHLRKRRQVHDDEQAYQVTGMMEKMDAMSGDSMKSGDKLSKDNKMKHDEMGMMGMKVSSMKMMSDHCDMSKTMDK